MDFDIIIGHSKSDSFRDRNLQYVLTYYSKKCPNSKIIVVEQESVSILPNIPNLLHIKIPMVERYSRGLGFNVGSRYVEKEWMFLVDNDCILEPPVLQNIDKFIGNHGIYIPYNYCTDLSNDDTEHLVKTSKVTGGIPRGGRNACVGGCMFVKKVVYNYLGGYEDLKGWGCEDEIFQYVANTIIGIGRIEGSYELFHMWHPSSSTKEYISSEGYKKNLKILEKIKKMTYQELISYIKSSKKTIN